MADQFQLKAIITAVDRLSPVLKGVQNSVKATRKSISDIGKAGSELTSKLGIPLALLGGASIASLTKAVGSFMHLGSAINDASEKIGINSEKLQELQYAGKLASVMPETLETGLAKLNKGLAEAADGKNQDLATLLRKLGISMRDANGQIRSAADVMPQLADGIAKNTNPALRARMAVAAFGKSGQELIPMLTEGSAGLAKAAAEARHLGVILSSDQIKSADELGDNFDRLKMSVQGLGLNIGSQLAPVLEPMITKLTEWIAANRQIISQHVEQAVSKIAKALDEFDWSGFAEGIKSFIDSMDRAAKAVGGWGNALLLVAVVINASTIVAVFDLIAAVGRAGIAFVGMAAKAYIAGNASVLAMVRSAAAAILVAGPVGAAGAAFAWLGGMAASAGGLITGAMGLVTAAIRGIGVAIMANPLGVLLGLASAAYLIYSNWETLKQWFVDFFEWIGNKFKSVIDLAKSLGNLFASGAPAGDQTLAVGNAQAGARTPLSSSGALQAAGGNAKLNGEMVVRFENAPAGMRAEPGKTNQAGLEFSPDVGYRSFATGGL